MGEKKIDGMSGGGGKNYYDLPPNSEQLLDLIEYVNMNGNIKDIFKACYRLGRKPSVSREYDLRKMALYALRELGRELDRKDYMALAEEVIGHHDTTPRTKQYINDDITDTGTATNEDDDMLSTEEALRRKVDYNLMGTKWTFAWIDTDGGFVIGDSTNTLGEMVSFNDYLSFKDWLEVKKQS